MRAWFRALFPPATATATSLPNSSQTSLQAQVLVPLVASQVYGLRAASLVGMLVLAAICAIPDDLGLCALSETQPPAKSIF